MSDPLYREPSLFSYPRQLAFGSLSIASPLWIRPISGRTVLSSFHGDGFRGNTAVLFEALATHESLRPIWLSRNQVVVDDITHRFGADMAYLSHSIAGLQALASAQFILFTHGTSDFPFLRLPARSKTLYAYHGLPTKRGEYMRREGEPPPKLWEKMLYRHRYRNIDWFLSSSPLVSTIFSQRFRLSPSCFIDTGYPSTDTLFRSTDRAEILKRIVPDSIAAAHPHVLLYAPTFRTSSLTRWFPFDDFRTDILNQYLETRNAVILIRRHPNDASSFHHLLAECPRLMDAGQERIEDINELLSISEGTISDYSSIALEGLLRDIPPIYIPYDVDDYERGFPIPYSQFSPGPRVHSMADFCHALDGILTPETSVPLPEWEAERDRVKRLFFTHTDGKATQRVIRFLETQM
jgi:CDP-glycerol glycerophosphotransferase (TagB/SpsB family)